MLNKQNQVLELNGGRLRMPRARAVWRGMLSKNFTLRDAVRGSIGFKVMKKLIFHRLARILLGLGAC